MTGPTPSKRSTASVPTRLKLHALMLKTHFWCVYLIALARDNFVRNEEYTDYLVNCSEAVDRLVSLCRSARIPEAAPRRSLKEVLRWTLDLVGRLKPKASYKPSFGGEMQLDIVFDRAESDAREENTLPLYVENIREALEDVLQCADLRLCLMVDRLDEIFDTLVV
jgi:hypothetical protein